MNIVNASDMTPSWNWLANEYENEKLIWHHYSSEDYRLPFFLPKTRLIRRFYSASQAVSMVHKINGLLVSHGPIPAFFSSSNAILRNISHIPHLVYSFNFTELPKRPLQKLMVRAYKQPLKFVTFSNMERRLYADFFEIPIDKIDMIHWSVHKPNYDHTQTPLVAGDYICALGSQGRDFNTLFDAMRILKSVKVIVVTNAESIAGLSIPDNVEIMINIPMSKAFNILNFSKLTVVPLKHSKVPCGHVTIVSGMFFKKPIVTTNSEGILDYVIDEHTGLYFEEQNSRDLAAQIERILDSNELSDRLSKNAYEFAENNCTEKSVIRYFNEFQQTLSSKGVV